jgi:predicted GNAT superfamily acetyltransferase
MIEIRVLETIEEYHAAEEIQIQTWGISDGMDVVPLHLLVTVQKNGGLVLGAFEKTRNEERLLGFVFGFLGLTNDGRLKHCSHMAGVLPEMQSQNLGYRMKLAQRDFVLSQGIDLITWTFDPLASLNAYLNIAKLGTVCNTYRRNVYGDLREELNEGLPSDRFEVEWHLTDPRVVQRIEKRMTKQGVEDYTRMGAEVYEGDFEGDLIMPHKSALPFQAETVLVEIPSMFHSLKGRDADLAMEWHIYMRDVFEEAFSRGYKVVDFLYQSGRSFYKLTKDWSQDENRTD